MPTAGNARWDTEVGRALYDQGATYVVIGLKLGVMASTVKSHANKHWPKRGRTRPLAVKQPRPFKPGEPTLPPLPSLQD